MNRVAVRSTLVLVVFMACLAIVQPPQATWATTIIYVDAAYQGAEDGSAAHPFDHIQEAIDHAASGDTVLVLPGTYVETLTLPRTKPGLTLRSLSGPTTTIIDGNFQETVILVYHSATIDGFTIQHANTDVVGTRDTGFGIAVNADGSVLMQINILNNVITANHGRGAIGLNSNVHPVDVTATISNNRIMNNTSQSDGAGISLNMVTGNPGYISIVNNLIYSNTGVAGGGLNLGTNARTFGGIFVANNTVYGNSAYAGGGVVGSSTSIQLFNNLIYSNTTDTVGEDLYFYSLANTSIVQYNLIGDGQYAGFGGNFAADPLLVDAASGDFHLRADSPAIDAGKTIVVDIDFDGQPRPFDALCGLAWDIGVDEWYPAADRVAPALLVGNQPNPTVQRSPAGSFLIYLPLVGCR